MLTDAQQLEKIGRYALTDEIGRGAMGIVYRAQDPLIQRTVAVKVLHLPRALSPENARIVRERFAREAQTAGVLDHPNIVKIFDVGQDEATGALYIVMEYVAGPSLEKLLAEDVPRAAIVEVIGQIASALDCAHARGIIHRDIKPANILFTEDGVPKLNDFGIARIASSDLTQDVRDLGTPVYMSPEQVNGQPLDARADLFALGVLCYRLLAGRVPFEGKDAVSIAYQIVHSTPPPPSWVEPSIPKAVDAVMERILAKDPAARYGSGREFQEALAAALLPEPPLPQGAATLPVAPRSRRSALAWGVPGLALLGLALAALWVFSDGAHEDAPRPQAPISPPPSREAAAAKPQTDPAPPPVTAPAARDAAPPAPPVPKKAPVAKPAPVVRRASPKASTRRTTTSPRASTTTTRGRTTKAQETSPPKIGGKAASGSSPTVAPASGPAALTVSLGHFVSHGTLTVFVDGRAVLAEEFTKGKLVPFQITTWDAMAVPSGRHQISARLEADGKDKVYRSEPLDAEFGAGKDVSLRISIKNEALVLRTK